MQNTMKRHPRVDVADVLRGIAVMGIILLHSIEHFNFYSFPDTAGQSEWLNFSDKAIWDGMFFLFGGKAYAVFALLFGFSFFIQYDNQRLRGKDFRGRFCWRLALLFLFGNLNASFFTAEVLVLYSLVGFILPLTCRLKDKWLLILACVLLIQPLPLYYAIRAACDPAFVTPAVPTGHLWAQTFAVQQGGTFWETVRVNLWEGQLASLAWAWDNGRVFQPAGPIPLRTAHRPTGLVPERKPESVEQDTLRSLGCIFPAVRAWQHVVGLHQQSVRADPAEPCGKFFV